MKNEQNATHGLDAIKESVKDIVDQGTQRVGEIKDRVVEVKDQAMSRGSAILDRTTDFIKANPLKSVAMAFGVGYVGMRLFRR